MSKKKKSKAQKSDDKAQKSDMVMHTSESPGRAGRGWGKVDVRTILKVVGCCCCCCCWYAC